MVGKPSKHGKPVLTISQLEELDLWLSLAWQYILKGFVAFLILLTNDDSYEKECGDNYFYFMSSRNVLVNE